MFENLSERLERSFKILKGEGKITEINVAETVKDIRKALLDADVSYKVAKEFCDRVKDKAMGQDVLTAVKPQQMMTNLPNSWEAVPPTSMLKVIRALSSSPVSRVQVKLHSLPNLQICANPRRA